MGRRHNAGWRQVTLLNETVPPPVELPSEIRSDVVNALAELLLAHLSVDAAPGAYSGDRDRSVRAIVITRSGDRDR